MRLKCKAKRAHFCGSEIRIMLFHGVPSEALRRELTQGVGIVTSGSTVYAVSVRYRREVLSRTAAYTS